MRHGKGPESGEVMIESLIVYLITFALLFMVLALMMITYQRFTVKTTAQDVAVKIAQNLRYSGVDIDDGTYTVDDIKSLKAYRYLFGNDDDLLTAVEKKAEKYAYNRLMKTSFNNVVTKNSTSFSVELSSDGPALRHVTVTISGDYKLPFDEMLDFFGLSKLKKYDAVECAECVDILDYVNYVDFTKNIVGIIYGDLGKVGKLVDKIWTLINKSVNY